MYTQDDLYRALDQAVFIYYKSHPNEMIEILSASMLRFEDGRFVEEETKLDWEEVVAKNNKEKYNLEEGINLMLQFIQIFQFRMSSKEIQALIDFINSPTGLEKIENLLNKTEA